MILVVDASVATKWFFAEAGDQSAREIAEGEDVLIAPDLIVAEVCNSAWKKVARAEASADRAREVAIALPRIFRELVPGEALAPRALDLAMVLRHPVYDCLYLALAELADGQLVTADKELASVALRAGMLGKKIRFIGSEN